jgi:hypothetical protein
MPKQTLGRRDGARRYIDHLTYTPRIALRASVAVLGAGLIWMLCSAPGAQAAACAAGSNDFTGSVSQAWNVAGNWSKTEVPTSTEAVCIPEGKGTITVAAGVKAEVKTLVAQSAVTIASTATLAISETYVHENPAENEAKASRFDGLTVDGTLSTAGDWILATGNVSVEGEVLTTAIPSDETVFRLLSGTLVGNGKFAIGFGNIGGTIEPGGPNTLGELHFTMLSSQGPGGTLVLDIASSSEFDQLSETSNFFWNGTLRINLLHGYNPPVGTTFKYMAGGPGDPTEFKVVEPAGFRAESFPGGTEVEVVERPPTAVTEAASEITQTSAVLNGSVNPNTEQVTICELEFGTTGPPYGSSATCPTPPGKGASPVAETKALTNLTPGTVYHYRIIAVNGDGESQGVDRTFTTLTATKGKEEEETPKEKSVEEKPSTSGGGATTTTTGGGSTTPTIAPSTMPGAVPATVATAPKAVEELLLGCSSSQLVLNDAYIHGGRVLLIGSAAKSLAGKKVKILFNEGKQVATAIVGVNGQFATTAPLPPAKVREALSTRYSAEIGKVRSLHLKLTRRLLLEPPKASGTTVTLTGQVTLPLTKPVAPVVVEEQLECGKTVVAETFTPPASGRFDITLSVPSNARAGIFRLTSKVAANAHAVKHGFTTFSLPLPVALG